MEKNRSFPVPLVLLAALLLAACPDRTSPIEVHLVKSSDCNAGPDPMQDVTHLRVRFVNATRCGPADENGDRFCKVENGTACGTDADCGWGTNLKEYLVDVGAGSLAFEEVPSGVPTEVQVAGFSEAPPDGVIVSYGHSGTFTVPVEKVDGAEPIRAVVFFRAVEKFSPVNMASDPSSQTTLSRPRAGHTATVLEDGRVLFAGGFDTSKVAAASLKDPASWIYTDTTEIFDPATGEVTVESPAMNRNGTPTPRAFHTATRLPNNQILVAGGEYASKKIMNLQANTILYDTADGGSWSPLQNKVNRSRHVAIMDQSNRVLLYGGLTWDGAATNVPAYSISYDWYDPSQNKFGSTDSVTSGPAHSAVGHAGLSLFGGKYLGVAGGSTMGETAGLGKLNADRGLRFLVYESAKMVEKYPLALPVPRSFPAFAGGKDDRYVITGGFSNGFEASKWWDLLPASGQYASSDLLYLERTSAGAQPQLLPGPTLPIPAGHICSVRLQDDRVLIVGGRGGKTAMGSVALAGYFEDNGNVNPSAAFTFSRINDLADPRFFHTCTLLPDGSVLVAGGIKESGSTFATLSSMEIFVPRPPAD